MRLHVVVVVDGYVWLTNVASWPLYSLEQRSRYTLGRRLGPLRRRSGRVDGENGLQNALRTKCANSFEVKPIGKHV